MKGLRPPQAGGHHSQTPPVLIDTTAQPPRTPLTPHHRSTLGQLGCGNDEKKSSGTPRTLGAQPHDRCATQNRLRAWPCRHSHPITRLRRASRPDRTFQTSPQANEPRTSSTTVDGWHVATPSRSARHSHDASQWSKHNNGHSHTPEATMPHRGTSTNPRGTLPRYTRAGHDQHPTRIFQDTSTRGKAGRNHRLGHTLSRNGPGEHCTDAHAETTSAPPPWTSTHRHTNSRPLLFRTHRLARLSASVRLTCPLAGSEIGQHCTNPTTGGPRPSTLPEPPDSAPHPHQTSPSTNRLADSSRPPNPDPPAQSAETQHLTRHVTPLGGNNLDTPTLPNRTHPTTGLPFSVMGSHTTTQPRHTAT